MLPEPVRPVDELSDTLETSPPGGERSIKLLRISVSRSCISCRDPRDARCRIRAPHSSHRASHRGHHSRPRARLPPSAAYSLPLSLANPLLTITTRSDLIIRYATCLISFWPAGVRVPPPRSGKMSWEWISTRNSLRSARERSGRKDTPLISLLHFGIWWRKGTSLRAVLICCTLSRVAIPERTVT